jgi:hypothetical protein
MGTDGIEVAKGGDGPVVVLIGGVASDLFGATEVRQNLFDHEFCSSVSVGDPLTGRR